MPEEVAAGYVNADRDVADVKAALEGARWMRRATGLRRIALSGGVFQNVLLQELLVPGLRREGFEVYRNRSVPPGDGGIALGQVYFLPGNL